LDQYPQTLFSCFSTLNFGLDSKDGELMYFTHFSMPHINIGLGPFSSPKKFEPLASILVMLLKKNPNIKLGITQLQEFLNVQSWAYKLVSIPHGGIIGFHFSLDLK
jgi:hypothetical protein